MRILGGRTRSSTESGADRGDGSGSRRGKEEEEEEEEEDSDDDEDDLTAMRQGTVHTPTDSTAAIMAGLAPPPSPRDKTKPLSARRDSTCQKKEGGGAGEEEEEDGSKCTGEAAGTRR